MQAAAKRPSLVQKERGRKKKRATRVARSFAQCPGAAPPLCCRGVRRRQCTETTLCVAAPPRDRETSHAASPCRTLDLGGVGRASQVPGERRCVHALLFDPGRTSTPGQLQRVGVAFRRLENVGPRSAVICFCPDRARPLVLRCVNMKTGETSDQRRIQLTEMPSRLIFGPFGSVCCFAPCLVRTTARLLSSTQRRDSGRPRRDERRGLGRSGARPVPAQPRARPGGAFLQASPPPAHSMPVAAPR